MLINSADDERNPPETGVTDAAMKRVKNGKLYLIPASTETRGHGTTGNAKFYMRAVPGNCCKPRRNGRCRADGRAARFRNASFATLQRRIFEHALR